MQAVEMTVGTQGSVRAKTLVRGLVFLAQPAMLNFCVPDKNPSPSPQGGGFDCKRLFVGPILAKETCRFELPGTSPDLSTPGVRS